MPSLQYNVDNIIFTDAGLAYIKAKVAAGQKGQIAYFKLSDTNIFVPTNADIAMYGNITYTGQAVDIWYLQYSADEVVFRAIVDSSKGDFLIGSIGFFADDNTLLFTGKFTYIHYKMKSTASSPGGRWTCQMRLLQSSILSAWDFSNMTTRYAAMNSFANITDAPDYPFDSYYTEMQLDLSFLGDIFNREGFLCISGNTSRYWFTSPFQTSDANATVYHRFDYDGGLVGDSHGFLG